LKELKYIFTAATTGTIKELYLDGRIFMKN